MRVLAAIAVSLLLCAHPAAGQELRLVTGNDYAPYADASLPHGGLAAEIVMRAFAEAEIEVQIDHVPWPEGFALARDGAYSGTFPYLLVEERQRHFAYSHPIYEIRRLLLSSIRNPIEPGRPRALAGLVLCVPIGYALHQDLLMPVMAGDLIVRRPATMSRCIEEIEAGRSDFVVVPEFIAIGMIVGLGRRFSDFHLSSQPISRDAYYLLVSRAAENGDDLIAAFNRGLADLRLSGAYDDLISRRIDEFIETMSAVEP